MTIGIYCLQFEGTDKVYIGQSVNIESRFTAHLRAFKHSVSSKKLQSAYDFYGTPSLNVLDVCSRESLNRLENLYIVEFDACNNGFNSLLHAEDLPNRHKNNLNGESLLKYTPEDVVQAFLYFIEHPTLKVSEISQAVNISSGMVTAMILGTCYSWLKNINLEAYTTHISNRGHGNSASSKGIKYPNIISPEGIVYSIDNRSRFSKEHGLDCGALGRVLRGVSHTHKGWKVCQ